MSHASNTFKAKSEIHTAYASKFKDYWVHHGYIPTPFDPIRKPRLLLQHINKLHVEKSWNMKNFMATDNGEMLVPALQSGDAIAVCDGSCKKGSGASAWEIEGSTSIGRIKGWNWVLGSTFGKRLGILERMDPRSINGKLLTI